ncbi:MAG: hypothetical protein IJV22_00670 [Bacteroidales bacterium]|nr:hypothetical protein [Bacteroidales bacterium]
MLGYFKLHPQEAIHYKEELQYIETKQTLPVSPYPFVQPIPNIESTFDSENQLPYVVHQNKRLYFPSDMSLQECRDYYSYLLCTKNLVGEQYTTHAPHRYQTENFHIDFNDILIDAVCAEVLFALDVVEKASHIYFWNLTPDGMCPYAILLPHGKRR